MQNHHYISMSDISMNKTLNRLGNCTINECNSNYELLIHTKIIKAMVMITYIKSLLNDSVKYYKSMIIFLYEQWLL